MYLSILFGFFVLLYLYDFKLTRILASWLRINYFYCHRKRSPKNWSSGKSSVKNTSPYLIAGPMKIIRPLLILFLSCLNIQDYNSVPSICFQHILRICLQHLNFKQTSTASTHPTLGSKYFPTVISSVGFSISSLNCSLLFARMLA